MKNEKRSFLLYENYEKLFGLLPMEQRGMLITAIFEYERQQLVSVTLSDAANMAFQCIKDTLDRDREAYLEKCKKQSENGKKGGRPSKATLPEKTQKTQWFSEKTKKADNDNDNENDNDNDIDNDIDNGNGNENENDIASEWESVNETDSSAHTSPTAFPAPPIGTPSPTAPRLSQEEREKLIAEGIGADYVREREERAALYAKRSGKSVYRVLIGWWQEDRGKPSPSKTDQWRSSGGHSQTQSTSYGHVNDFFAESLRHAFD